MITDNFGGSENRDRQNQSWRSPNPGPEQKRKTHHQRIQAQSPAYNSWIDEVDGEDVQSDDRDQNDNDAGFA